ncbi:MAG: Uma2 family endonuclease [Phototrophicales bacterium]|nr:MAG: Uma2 family endonuclease [Phototrophicales bacterium]
MLPEEVRQALRQKRKMTVEEYMQLPETTTRMELIDGELIVYDGQDGNMPAPKDLYQQILSVIVIFLSQYLPAKQLRVVPTDVHLDQHVVQPDILWVNPDSDQCILMDDGYLHGAPDFVIEILSPNNTRRDKIDKFYLYEKYGVREYWIVNPEERYIEVYIRRDDTFHWLGGYKMGQTFTSPILNNASIDVTALLG